MDIHVISASVGGARAPMADGAASRADMARGRAACVVSPSARAVGA